MLCIVWNGINVTGDIQKERYIVDVDCVNPAKNMVYQQSEICGKLQERDYQEKTTTLKII